jgi:predicted phage terminase large subunit-like protein
MTAEQRQQLLSSLSRKEAEALLFHWPFWARPKQLWPSGNWHTWLVLAGRGFGKTRTGSEAIRQAACGSTPLSGGRYRQIALIGETAADVREVMVRGPSGVLAVHAPDFRPTYIMSQRLLEWPNGARAMTFNATEPDQLRGPEHDLVWGDEIAKWRYARETYDMMRFGLRIGELPRFIATTTPRPIPLVLEITAAAASDPGIVLTRGSTFENAAALSASFLRGIEERYAGTRLGRQELEAELLLDVPNALWTRENLDRYRMSEASLPEMQRIVIGVDPAVSAPGRGANEGGCETGIVVAGVGTDGRLYVIDDLSVQAHPAQWARRVALAYEQYAADAVIAEANQGGELVAEVLRNAAAASMAVTMVHATRGKMIRAEPIAALYEQGRVSHVGSLPQLEDQMVICTPFGVEGARPGERDGLVDRVDALVWALTALSPQIRRKIQFDDDKPKQKRGWMA